MVLEWSPEPAKCSDDVFPVHDSQVVEMDMEESDEDHNSQSPYFGYELLAHEPDGVDNDRSAEESEEERTADSVVASPPSGLSQSSSVEQVGQARTERSDIAINSDEVRQIMSGITLPSTAIPSWAESIPENQWTSFLVSRIKNMQSGNSISK